MSALDRAGVTPDPAVDQTYGLSPSVAADVVVSVNDAPAWAERVDVVVAGSGGSGLAAAVMAADAGSSVIVVEKGAEAGGTTSKSGGGCWVPDNGHMRSLGLEDSRDGALHYMAKTSRPYLYAPDAPNLGLPEWEYELLCLFYDEGARAFSALEQMGALHTVSIPEFPNYYPRVAEDVHKFGRTFGPAEADGTPVGGPELIRQLTEALESRGGRIAAQHRVRKAVVDGDRVVGVVVDTPEGERWIHAAQGVVLATGGFTHNAELRRSHLQGPVFGGCAAVTNEGDMVPIVQSLGAEMRNMAECWGTPILLERALVREPSLHGTFNILGDGMLCVNKYGRRTMNEKAVYPEATKPMLTYDSVRCEYPNMLMFPVWDQASYDTFRGLPFDGGMMPAEGADDSHVLSGDTLGDLAQQLDARLATLEPVTGGVRLAEDFVAQLTESVARFNEFARKGHDDDFERGEASVELFQHKFIVSATQMSSMEDGTGMAAMTVDSVGWAVPLREGEAASPNPTMRPLAGEGPYYASIVAAGTLDTKGGPRVDRHGRVLRNGGRAIEGLYAVGNVAASPTGQAYFGAGGTLGPMITFAWLAGQHVASMQRTGAPSALPT